MAVKLAVANKQPRIEHGVPLAPKISGTKPSAIWRQMVVGDSIFFAGAKRSVIASRFLSASRSTGWKFAIRQVDGGIRVWRTA